jgi:hypothetical protein
MKDKRRFERCQQCRSEQIEVALDAGSSKKSDDVSDAECSCRTAEAVFRSVFRRSEDFALYFHHGDPGSSERDEALDRRRARTQRWGAEHECLLQFSLGVIEQCLHQSRSIAEAPKNCALAHTGPARDSVHRHRVDTSLGNEEGCGVEQKYAVTCCVTALDRRGADLGEGDCAHGIRLQGRGM